MTTTNTTKTKWVLDPSHSEVQFKVKHLMISTVTGQFNKFEGTIETDDEDFTTAEVDFSADVNSISTNNEQRDAHLRNPDFFDADNHPRLQFKTEKMEKVDDENFKVYGILTLRGIAKKITLNAELGGVVPDAWGNTRVGFSLTGKLNRKDFGVSFGLLSDATSAMLSDEVRLFINAQFVKQKVAELQEVGV